MRVYRFVNLVILFLFIGICLQGCIPKGTIRATGLTPNFKKVSVADLPDLMPEGSLENFKKSLAQSIEYCKKLDPSYSVNFESRKVSRSQWCTQTASYFQKLANQAHDLSEVYLRARVELDWYQNLGSDGAGLVQYTGYYFPLLDGSRVASQDFTHPLYSKPDDLVNIDENGKKIWRKKNPDGTYSMYPERKVIDGDGILKGLGLEIAYVRDALTAFILQVQGSGAVLLHPEIGPAQRILVNYAAGNGQPYVSIRRILKDQGVEEKYLTLPGIRQYFTEHPDQMLPVLLKSPSYVFFREAQEGPYGTGDILITPEHSIAVDQNYQPYGGISLIKTQKPEIAEGAVSGWKEFTQLVSAQDTGGAIKGAGRVDVYWGEGNYAELAAGNMNQTGTMYYAVVPESISAP